MEKLPLKQFNSLLFEKWLQTFQVPLKRSVVRLHIRKRFIGLLKHFKIKGFKNRRWYRLLLFVMFNIHSNHSKLLDLSLVLCKYSMLIQSWHPGYLLKHLTGIQLASNPPVTIHVLFCSCALGGAIHIEHNVESNL